MIYENIEIFNAEEVLPSATNEGICWRRVPETVEKSLESAGGLDCSRNCTGVELRFVMNGDKAVVRMAKERKDEETNVFHVFFGSVQGSWEDCELDKYVGENYVDYVVKKPSDFQTVKKMAEKDGEWFSPDVCRIIFDRGFYRLAGVRGDVRPPEKKMLPKKTILFYGSSITHGSNSIDASHSFASVVGWNLKCDVRNLGFAGSCYMEPPFIDYIAESGEKGLWDVAVLELGINVLPWEEAKIRNRVRYAVETIAKRNRSKKVFVISPFYSNDDFSAKGVMSDKWRKIIKETTEVLSLDNVVYVNGKSVLPSSKYLSADLVHPNVYGAQKIADKLTRFLRKEGI